MRCHGQCPHPPAFKPKSLQRFWASRKVSLLISSSAMRIAVQYVLSKKLISTPRALRTRACFTFTRQARVWRGARSTTSPRHFHKHYHICVHSDNRCVIDLTKQSPVSRCYFVVAEVLVSRCSCTPNHVLTHCGASLQIEFTLLTCGSHTMHNCKLNVRRIWTGFPHGVHLCDRFWYTLLVLHFATECENAPARFSAKQLRTSPAAHSLFLSNTC